ncbi:MAG: hypothetical protein WBP42_11550 [Candidatus Zixiibacteriota bacterium]
MKRIIWLLAILLLLCPQVFGTTYYVTKAGSDSNDGLSWATAWLTVNKVNTTIVAGDEVRFGTGRWLGTSLLPPTGGTVTDTTIYACSTRTIDTRGRAVISGGESVTGWTLYTGNIWEVPWAPAAGYYDAGDGDKSYTLTQNDSLLNPQLALVDVNAPGEFFHNASTNRIYAYLWDAGNPTTKSMVASARPAFWVKSVNTDYIYCYGIDFRMGKGGTVFFEDVSSLNSDHVTFEQCNITRVSFLQNENPAVIFVRGNFTNPSYDSTNINDYVRYLSFKACSIGVATAEPTNVLAHRGSGAILYDATNVFWDGCAFYDLPGDGAESKNSYASCSPGCIYQQVTIRNSTFNRLGGVAYNCYTKGDNDSLYGNTVTDAFALFAYGGNTGIPASQHLYVCNNSVYKTVNLWHMEPPYASGGIGKVKYNAMYDRLSDAEIATKYGSGSVMEGIVRDYRFMTIVSSLASFSLICDSNIYFDPSVSFSAAYPLYGATYNFSQWNSAGFDLRSSTSNPGFNNPAAGDFSRPSSVQEMNQTYGGRTWTRFGAWQPPSKYPNPLNTWLDSMSTIDDRTIYLPGMDAANPPDGDTIALMAKYKIVIWSAGSAGATRYGAFEAARLKRASPDTKLILYTSLDHGLHTLAVPIDTTDPSNEWNLDDEYSHYRLVCEDSSKSYYSLFYQFAEDTKILLSPVAANGFIYYDTVFFNGYTAPVSDDDSSSVVPDFYSSPSFAAYGTLTLVDSVMVGGSIHRRYNYKGTPIGSKVTRVLPDFSNPLARWAEMKYALRAMSQNLANIGGTGNDVYGWGPLSDSGFYWDGLFLDNSADHQLEPPEGSTLISGGNILSSRGVIGSWYADSTKSKMRGFHKEYFTQLTNYMNNPANFWNNEPRATAANFGTWTSWMSNSPYREWYGADNGINIKCLEYASADKSYNLEAYETAGNGRSTSELIVLDSLARANDFYVAFSGRTNAVDTTVASGWGGIWQGFLRSNWVRYQTFLGNRGIFAMQPIIFLSNGYLPCTGGSGTAYQGLNYSPFCNDRAEVDSFFNLTTLMYMTNYDLGYRVPDSAARPMSMTDASGAAVTVFRSFFRKIVGSDTTDSWTYYFPRKLSSWEWRRSGNHKVVITPPNARASRLEYSGNLTTISGAAQDCWIGDQLILSYTHSAVETPVHSSPPNGSTNQNLSVTLDWSTIANATGYQYQVDDNSDFSSIFYTGNVTPSTGDVAGLSGSKTYFWRVRSVNATDTSAWTTAWTFATVAASGFDLAYVVNTDTVYANLTYDRDFIDYYNLKRHYIVHVIRDDSAALITDVDAYDGYFISETLSGSTLTNLKSTTKGVFMADRAMNDDFDVATSTIGPFLLGEPSTALWTLGKVTTSHWITSQMSPQIYFDFSSNNASYPFMGLPSSAQVLFNSTLRNWDGIAGDPNDTSYCYVIETGGALATSGTAAGRRAIGLCFYPFFTSSVSALIQGGYCHPVELLGNMSAWVFSDEGNTADGGYNCYSHEQHEVNQGWAEFGSNWQATFSAGRLGWDYRIGLMFLRLWSMQAKILPGWAPDSLVLTIPVAATGFGFEGPPTGDLFSGFDLWIKGYEITAAAQWHMPTAYSGISGLPNSGGRDSTWANRQYAINHVVGAVPWAAIDLLAGTDHAEAAFDSVHVTAANLPNDGSAVIRLVLPGSLLRKPNFNWAVFKSFDNTGGQDSADIEIIPASYNSPRGIYAQKAELYLSPTQTVPLLIRKKKIIDE